MNQYTNTYTQEDSNKIIDYYLTHENNTVPNISKELKYGESFISNTIDRYFKSKMNKNKKS